MQMCGTTWAFDNLPTGPEVVGCPREKGHDGPCLPPAQIMMGNKPSREKRKALERAIAKLQRQVQGSGHVRI